MKNKLFRLWLISVFLGEITPSYGVDPSYLLEGDSILPVTTKLIQKESFNVVCEDGAKFSIECPSDYASSIVRAKRDGPIVYVEDDRGCVSSYEYEESEDILKRSLIFRFPIFGKLYSVFWDSSNAVQLPKMGDDSYAKWAISYFTYPEGLDVRTISFYIMTQTNPITIRNMDPWLPPWNFYDHAGPRGMAGVDIAASGERVAIIGYKKNAQRAFAFRSINYDLNGGNPMVYYRLMGGYIRYPSFVMKKLAEKIGVTRQILDIPTADWKIVPLTEEHQPQIRFSDKGEHIMIPKVDGGVSIYDCQRCCWLDDWKESTIFTSSLLWPKYEAPIKKPKKVQAWLNGVKGQLHLASQEPIFGTFISDTGGETPIYHVSPSFVSALLNYKYFFDKDYNLVDLRYGDS